jgi:NAD(P)H dehydrogenase (quinone)
MPAAGFVVTPDSEDGAETGVLGLYTALMHSGAVIVPAGRSDQLLPHGAGNPYGTSMTAGAGPSGRLAARREAAAHMRELVRVARRLRHSVRQVNMGENILVDHETQHP